MATEIPGSATINYRGGINWTYYPNWFGHYHTQDSAT